MTHILGFGGYAPLRVVTNDDWAQRLDTSDEWITQRTGIKRRHYAAD
ncbi:MAG TPA: 3-oxoacyl-ACP synthase, partial [Acidimicrobiia bacterium]|nr:3-oxoacyl-ACP synthase [Acidimicrobiia bacterium]